MPIFCRPVVQLAGLTKTATVIVRRSLSERPVTDAYEKLVRSGAVRHDRSQLSLASKLDDLHRSLVSSDPYVPTEFQLNWLVTSGIIVKADSSTLTYFHRHLPTVISRALESARYKIVRTVLTTLTMTSATAHPKGLYVYGSVGVGKSFLMDLFYEVCGGCDGGHSATRRRRRKRSHFHEFMLDVHKRIHEFKKQHPREDPIPPVALDLAQEARLLCFDEFQVTDIADAMIMKRLFTLLFDMGVIVVSTSNRPPDALYEGGLNRSAFLPFVETLKDACDVFPMDNDHDYRRDKASCFSNEATPTSYFWPSNDSKTIQSLNDIFGANEMSEVGVEVVPVMMGRTVKVPKANKLCGWFNFNDLCQRPLGAADFIALSQRFPVLIVENVPQLGAQRYNEARRFVTLIDALYEARTRLVVSAEVPLEHLFQQFDARVESRDGDEEMTMEANGIKTHSLEKEIQVIGEGGSSSSNATTIIRTKDGDDMEWSATGRIGVSLAQLSAVKDVAFSFQRAESRLMEMTGDQWLVS